MATVRAVEEAAAARTVTVEFPAGAAAGVQLGASVALNGTCLTVVQAEEAAATMAFDVIGETLDKTNLGELGPGSKVNFERAAKIGDEIGGHNVSGHVHTVGRIRSISDAEKWGMQTVCVQIGFPPEWRKYVLPKGFIAIDGASLTVGEVGPDWLNVYLIPETLRMTVLSLKGPGDSVNVEIDAQTQAIVDTVERVLGEMELSKVSAA